MTYLEDPNIGALCIVGILLAFLALLWALFHLLGIMGEMEKEITRLTPTELDFPLCPAPSAIPPSPRTARDPFWALSPAQSINGPNS